MRTTIKTLAAGGATMALLALGAGPAMADNAFWSDTENGIKWSGTITVEKDGGSPKTCTTSNVGPGDIGGDGWFLVRSLGVPIASYDHLKLTCTGSTALYLKAQGAPGYNEAFPDFLLNVDYGHSAQPSPYGNYWQDSFPVEFTNAAGANPSQIAFDDTHIGYTTSYQAITATGTIDVTDNDGATLTLSQ